MTKRAAALIAIAVSGWANTSGAVASVGTTHPAGPWVGNELFTPGFALPETAFDGTTPKCDRSNTDWRPLGSYFLPMTWNVDQCRCADASLRLWNVLDTLFESNEMLPSSLQLTRSWSSWTGPLQLSVNLTTTSNPPDEPVGEPGEVAPLLTPISGSIAARELRRAWKTLRHKPASNDTVLILTAHWAHETHGGRSMFNYNFGGIKGHAPDGQSCVRDAHEGSGYHVRALRDRFRSYGNVRDGAEDYLSLLLRKYAEAVNAAERGDITDFVSALKRGGYFTGSESEYARSMSELVVKAFEQGFDALSSDKS